MMTISQSLVAAMMLMMISASTALAQAQPPADIIGWGFDEFHIGGETGYHPRILRDSFAMDFTYQYGMYPSYSYMTDSTRWAAEPNVPRLKDLRAVVDQSVATGVKMVFAPDRLFFFSNNFSSLEHYHTFASDSVHLPDFKTKLMGDSIRIQTPHLYGLDLKVAHGHDTLIAGSPRFTQEGAVRGDGAFWTGIGLPDSASWYDVTATLL